MILLHSRRFLGVARRHLLLVLVFPRLRRHPSAREALELVGKQIVGPAGELDAMELTNDLVDIRDRRRRVQRAMEDFRFPFKICCVLRYDIPEANEGFAEVHSFCDDAKIIFYSRGYNIDRHEEDMCIQRLPCYLIYADGHVQKTIPWNEHPIPKIKAHLRRYLESETRKRERASLWETRLNRLRSFFKLPSFKRKSRLEHEAPKPREVAVPRVPIEL